MQGLVKISMKGGDVGVS